MSNISKLFLVIITSLFSGCALLVPGDMFFEVKGSIPREALQNGNTCSLSIIGGSSEYLLFFDKQINSDFSGQFVLAVNAFSAKIPISTIVKCSDGREYKTHTYMIGPRSFKEFPNHVIDLGELMLYVLPSIKLDK